MLAGVAVCVGGLVFFLFSLRSYCRVVFARFDPFFSVCSAFFVEVVALPLRAVCVLVVLLACAWMRSAWSW
jgi:hypothetical protein